MYLIAIAWLYVALMMALAEASSSQGSVLGAVITFLLYGVAPMALVMYLVGTPARRKARRAAEAAEAAAAAEAKAETANTAEAAAQTSSTAPAESGEGDGRHEPAAEPLPPVGKEA